MYERRKYQHTNSFIRLIDFGFAIQEKQWKASEGVGVGTIDYVAPEIINKEPLNIKSDMWAVGVSVFCMLTGYTPFYRESTKETVKAIKSCDYEFDPTEWSYYSKEC